MKFEFATANRIVFGSGAARSRDGKPAYGYKCSSVHVYSRLLHCVIGRPDALFELPETERQGFEFPHDFDI